MAEDRYFPENTTASTDSVIGLATPGDRLAAYILDCVLLLPLVQLTQAPVKRWILESFLFDNGADVSTYRFFNLAIFIFLFITYYSICIWMYGQTLGKKYFGIKVISYNGRLSFLNSLSRSVFIFFEFLCMGFPFLAIFSHPMRRPIHDRAADTLVISQNNPSSFPSKRERTRASYVAAFYGFMLMISFISYSMVHRVEIVETRFETASEACQSSVENFEDDIEVLIEHYLVKKIDDDCLFSITRSHVWDEDESVLSQFAMSLATKNNPDLSGRYLQSICKLNKNHHLCDMSQWVLSYKFKDIESTMSLLEKLDRKKPYNFVRAMVAGSLRQLQKFSEVESLLKPIENPGELRPLLASLNFHSLLGQLKWEEAAWIYRTHDEVGDQDILDFMRHELQINRMTTRQQLQLLDFFYPNLVNRDSTRRPASIENIPNEIKDIYQLLEGRL